MTIYDSIEFDPKDPAEDLYVGFDFGPSTDTITFAVFEITRLSGSGDSNPSAMKSGGPVVQGTRKVLHLLTAGVDFTDYQVRCTATRGSEKLVGVGLLRVRSKKARL